MARVVVFGVRDLAELAHFYLEHDSPHEVVAFSVDRAYLEADTFRGLPVVPFEEVTDHFPPGDHEFFAPLTSRRMNRDRRAVYEAVKAKGYRLISYVSSRATVFPEAQIGENCFILEDNTLQPFTPIGDNVVMWSGNHVGHHGSIGDHCFLTSHVVVAGRCTVEPHSFLGCNATLRDGIRLAEGTLAGMGACVTRDTEPWRVYVGNPAKKRDETPSDEVL